MRLPFAVLRYIFVFLPLWAFYSFRRLPLWQQALTGVLSVGLLAAAGVMAFRVKQSRHVEREVQRTWQEFELAAKQLDVETMKTKLNYIGTLKPTDPLLPKRRQSIDKGEGPTDDPVMVVYWLNRYITEQKIPEAAREARKRVATTADDWQARCILAREALAANKVDEARTHLAEIPSPMSNRYPVGPGELNHGLWLFRMTGMDDSSLRMYRALKVVPVLRFPDIAKFDPREQVQLLECYVGSFEDLEKYPELPKFWVGSSRLARSLADDPNATLPSRVHLAHLQAAQHDILKRLVARKFLTAAEAKPLEEELLERLEEIWTQVLKRDPGETEAYLGLARIAAVRGRIQDMLAFYDDGIAKARDHRTLVREQFQLLRQIIGPRRLLERMDELVTRFPKDPELRQWAAEAAMAAGRLDRALEICKEAQEVAPDLIWPHFLEARIYLDQERNVDKALAIIERYKKYATTESIAAEQYARALALNDRQDEMPAFLDRLAAEAPRPGVAVPALRVALRDGFAAETFKAAVKLLDRFETAPTDQGMKDLLQVVGEASLAAAEPAEPGQPWNVTRARVGVRSLDRLLTEVPNDLFAANVMAMLHLKGFNSADAAERVALPLRAALDAGTLPEQMYGTLGAISLAQSRYDDARRLLSLAIQRNPTAEEYVQLGLAHYYLNDPAEARRCMREAASLPRSARVKHELSEALSLIDGTKS